MELIGHVSAAPKQPADVWLCPQDEIRCHLVDLQLLEIEDGIALRSVHAFTPMSSAVPVPVPVPVPGPVPGGKMHAQSGHLHGALRQPEGKQMRPAESFLGGAPLNRERGRRRQSLPSRLSASNCASPSAVRRRR